ncbi:hypothetical protein CLOM_g13707 [Closterium sp. NIES-68]|nr:hypothetical protein CLOM_g4210 [Closterium sp. NIES-68]GJP54646.1 hypothetical protein CLOM_g13707 [Closterium sp. NIES-68]GJP73497.1 hypothetical protein CLOP_g4201 [Closterium sp. NIES-67]
MEAPSGLARKSGGLASESSVSLDSRLNDEEKASSFGSTGSEDSAEDDDVALPPDSKLVVKIDGKDDGKDNGKLAGDGKSEPAKRDRTARMWFGLPWWQCGLCAAAMVVVLFLIVFGAVLLGLALAFHTDDVVIRVTNLDFLNMSFSQIPVSDGTGSKTLMLSAHLNVSANVFNPNDNTMVVEQLFVAIDGMQHPMTNTTLPGFTLAPKGNRSQQVDFVVSGYPLFDIAANTSLLLLADNTKNLPFRMVVKSLGHVMYRGFATPSYFYTYACNVTYTPGVEGMDVKSCHKTRVKA